MKKKLLAAALSSAIMLVAAQTTASSNFFADVPADDWSYTAVNKLIATGHVADYTEPIPQGRIMSRLEMAMIVDAAQQNLSAFTSDEQAVITRLGKEYFYDIKKLQLLNRLDNLDEKALEQSGEDFTPEEKQKIKTLANRFEVTGFAQVRHDHIIQNNAMTSADDKYLGVGDKTRSKPSTYTKIDVTTKYKVNDTWNAYGKLIMRGSTDHVDDFGISRGENESTIVPELWLTGKIGGGRGVDVKLGRWNEWTPMGWGYDIDCDIAGVQFSFGKPIFRTTLTAGKIDLWDNLMMSPYLESRGYDSDEETNFLGVRWDYYHPNQKLDAHFGFHGMDAMTSRYQDPHKKNHVLYYYVHAGYKFDNNWQIRGGVINSNAKMIDHPWGEGGPQVSRNPGLWLGAWYSKLTPKKSAPTVSGQLTDVNQVQLGLLLPIGGL